MKPAWRRGRPGLSLIETVIALFILLSAFTIIMTLFFRSNRALIQVEEKAMAGIFSETVLDDIRAWASDPDSFHSDWSHWSSAELAEFPGYKARVTVITPESYTPCSQLELDKPVPEQRQMISTLRDLKVVVEHSNRPVLTVHTRIAEPERTVDKVEVSLVSGTSSLSAWQKAVYQARLVEADGEVIPDVSFHWTVVPDKRGNGTVKIMATNYAQGEVTNVYRGLDGVDRHILGPCRLQAVARYRGREYTGRSELMEMTP